MKNMNIIDINNNGYIKSYINMYPHIVEIIKCFVKYDILNIKKTYNLNKYLSSALFICKSFNYYFNIERHKIIEIEYLKNNSNNKKDILLKNYFYIITMNSFDPVDLFIILNFNNRIKILSKKVYKIFKNNNLL